MAKVRSDRKMNPVKVAVLCSTDLSFRALLLPQMTAAKQAGYVVHGISSNGPYFRQLREKGFIMYPVTLKRSISPFSDMVALWRMYWYFKCERFDIVHTHMPKDGLLGQLAAKLADVPITMSTVHGFYFHDNMKPWVRRFYIAIEWIIGKCSTTLLCQNPEDIETAIRLGICKRDKIKLLGNGVDLSKFAPWRFDADFRRRKRTEIGVPEDAVVVGIIGRLVREKGYFELFEAMRNVMAVNNNVWLVIIGPEEPEKADRISTDSFSRFGIEHHTRYLGLRNDMPELLACCNIYTLPSWREGFPRSAIEAAAMGLPIVATNIRGCRQVVEDGVNGFLVPPQDSTALKNAITKLVEDDQLREKMGHSGFLKARREFDEKTVCRIVIDTYKKLLATKVKNARDEGKRGHVVSIW